MAEKLSAFAIQNDDTSAPLSPETDGSAFESGDFRAIEIVHEIGLLTEWSDRAKPKYNTFPDYTLKYTAIGPANSDYANIIISYRQCSPRNHRDCHVTRRGDLR
ncbi:hypothetical protein [Methanofollis fontis]|uniref:hypothetical protein n=1 Tax=Methanofollis fontis TaxID=2052832 RepID=UPI00102EF18A|nr:hypothetical protein [Methanofollis fontis]